MLTLLLMAKGALGIATLPPMLVDSQLIPQFGRVANQQKVGKIMLG
jgi:hypothetical protein